MTEKIIVMLCILFSFADAQSQDCDYFMNELDKFEGATKIITNEKKMGSGDFGSYKFSLARSYQTPNDYTDVTMLIVKFSSISKKIQWCIKSKGNITLLLADDTKVNLIGVSKIDCSYEFLNISYMIFNYDIEKLKNSPIKAFRINFYDGYDDCNLVETLTDNKNKKYSPGNYFIDNIKCLFPN